MPTPPEAAPAEAGAARFQSLTGVGPETMDDLNAYKALIEDWSGRMNLVGPSAMAEFWDRHALDSAQLLDLAPDARRWVDLGSGAGFPGVVLAILLKGRAGAHVDLVDSQAKRCRFLAEVVERLSLPAQVRHARAEDLAIKADIVTARACAPLARLLGYAWPHLRLGATGLFLKGQDIEVELAEATIYWNFQWELIPSRSRSDGRIIRIEGLTHV